MVAYTLVVFLNKGRRTYIDQTGWRLNARPQPAYGGGLVQKICRGGDIIFVGATPVQLLTSFRVVGRGQKTEIKSEPIVITVIYGLYSANFTKNGAFPPIRL
jgi:hypothetical protein